MKKDRIKECNKPKTVGDLKIGEFGYITPCSLSYNKENVLVISKDMVIQDSGGETVCVKIGRAYLGYYVEYSFLDGSRRKRTFDAFNGNSHIGLIEITYSPRTPTLADEILAADTMEYAQLLAKLIQKDK
jgi:hypothetical protein